MLFPPACSRVPSLLTASRKLDHVACPVSEGTNRTSVLRVLGIATAATQHARSEHSHRGLLPALILLMGKMQVLRGT